jgi:HPt (histidine-containing phosphotransfer) domain-containing protein
MAKLQREALDAIRELSGDSPELLKQVVQAYLDSMPPLLSQLNAGFSSSDLNSIRHAAHTMKSSSASLGAIDLSQMCAKLEAAARAGAIPADAPSAKTIEAEFAEVRVALIAEIEAA